MDLKLELVLIPVSDVDRAKDFYVEKVGFKLDVDHRMSDEFRIVQMTPPGSACSITVGTGITDAAPGSVRGTHLVVTDITMPPNPFVFERLEMIAPLLERALGEERDGDWRLLPTVANRMPTAASYLRRPGDSAFRAFKLDVLRVKEGAIAEITTFGPAIFPAFGLPPTL